MTADSEARAPAATMPTTSSTRAQTPPPADLGSRIREAGPGELAAALQASRTDTLATFARVAQHLPCDDHGAPKVPQRATLNPPLWELGHIGWFQAWWLARNPQRHLGMQADPDVARTSAAGVRPGADALYDSSRVPHDTRWSLPLPDVAATQADLAAQLHDTLALLAQLPAQADDRALYLARLCLLHEDMHHEAALYMAQALDIPISDPRWQPRPTDDDGSELYLDAQACSLGRRTDQPGFAFDNEYGPCTVDVPATCIDRHLVSWARYLPFVEQEGYGAAQWWDADGQAWLQAHGLPHPTVLRRSGGSWQRKRYGQWQPLLPQEAALHLSAHEARAWCRWAGRQLPTEAQWLSAALRHPDHFAWGQAWEWTASAFMPYPGFTPHPYRDYSAPFFDGRPVLRGASFATQPRLRHLGYRNYFSAERTDIFAGFRSCRVEPRTVP